MSAAQVSGASPSAIASQLGEMSKSTDQSQYSTELCDELDEYFRKNFR